MISRCGSLQPVNNIADVDFLTVAANQKRQLATFDGEINRTNGKRVILISKRHVTQLQRLPVGKRLRALETLL